MYDLAKALKVLKFDKRMKDLNIKRKILTPEEYNKHLERLDDISHLKAVEEEPSSKTTEESEE